MKINRDNVSIVQAGCQIEGMLKFSGYLIVAGTIKGQLEAETVITREGSGISGNLHAQSLSVAGLIEGDIVVETLSLMKTADVNGTVQCANLIVEEGGRLNATITWLNRGDSASLTPGTPQS